MEKGEVLNCTVIDEKTVECFGERFSVEEGLLQASNGLFWVYLCLYMVLVLFAGLMSGLTIGLLSLDPMSLLVLKRGGKPKEQKYAARILLLVKRHHLLLVTLLLANAAAVETMPIALAKITNEIVAIIVSVTAVLLFGEIIPQALCTRFGLAIGYYCSPIIFALLVALCPIAFPISLLLDKILGKEHGMYFRRAELRELVKMHGTHEKSNEEPLSYDEVLIVKSALEMRDKTVQDVMTPIESVYMLEVSGAINRKIVKELTHHGHSRVPIYQGSRDNICGILLVKRLIGLDPDDSTPISTLQGAQTPPPSCLTTTPLYDILNIFQTGKSHLALVYEEEGELSEPELKGIITLEDVIEELIGEEIVDETDVYVDVHRRTVVARAKLAFQRQSCSADQSQSSQVRRLGLPERRPRSWSATVPQSPTAELTQEEVFGQQLYIDAEVEEKEGEGAPSTGVGSKASSQKKAASKQRKGGGISKSKSLESDANSFTEEDTAPLLLN